jgi:uncharacterized protein YkwD
MDTLEDLIRDAYRERVDTWAKEKIQTHFAGLLICINESRVDNGAGKVRINLDLCTAAADQADWRAKSDTLPQREASGEAVDARARRAGFVGRVCEVVGTGKTEADAFQSWMADATQREAVLDVALFELGLGKNGTVWVGLFGRPNPPPSRKRRRPR